MLINIVEVKGLMECFSTDANAALHFMKSMSSLSSGEENEPSPLDRKLSLRASRRLSTRKQRPGSAFDRQKVLRNEMIYRRCLSYVFGILY